ncbi:MAG: tyrosine--tRNA ligase [Planctomycetota bacterium]
MNLVDILTERGLVAQSTDPAIRERFERPVTAYIGFDPTADSLCLHHLVPIMGMAWLQRCGHKPLALVGGATALVGDPSGKNEMRKMLTRDDVRRNAAAYTEQIGRVVRFGDGASDAKLVDNADWLAPMTWIDLLREAGPHFSVNRMLSMESVKGRLDGGGISFLEFNYMVMQAYDFLHLHRAHGCTVQMGAQDQWGNIVMGIELGRRADGAELFGLTFPLLLKSDGSKFGKTEKGAVWLSAEKTPPYEFYQFLRNTADADVERFLTTFTFLLIPEIKKLTAGGGQALNGAKEVLAWEVTRMVHGQAEADKARDSARRAFSSAHDVSGDAVPHADLAAQEVSAGIAVLDLLIRSGLAPSKGEARRLIEGGGVSVGETKVIELQHRVSLGDVVSGRILIRVGKKRLFRFDVR